MVRMTETVSDRFEDNENLRILITLLGGGRREKTLYFIKKTAGFSST